MNYDKNFISAYEALNEFEKKGTNLFQISLHRDDVMSYTYDLKITDNIKESYFYVKKIIISLLWIVGGNRIYVRGSKEMFNYLKLMIQNNIDKELVASLKSVEDMFNKPIIVEYKEEDHYFITKDKIININSDFKGHRIGFDAGGSDRKVTAVIDGNVVYQEEVLWTPKVQTDYHYHYDGILDSLKRAASYLDHIDAIGISTSGIVYDNQMIQAALFFNVNKEDRDKYARTMYLDILNEHFKGVSHVVVNDGDVTALAGAKLLNEPNILGLAMGTSQASGFCYDQNTLSAYFYELGKISVDFSDNENYHYNVKCQGAGSCYLSQNGIIRLAKLAGYEFDGTLALQLRQIQEEANKNNPDIIKAYEDMGEYLGYSVLLYSKFFKINKVLMLGRVMSGVGGDVIINVSNKILKDHGSDISIITADEKFRRLGQSYIAASMPIV